MVVADHAHLVAVANVAVGEHLAFVHVLQSRTARIRRRRAVDLLGHPVAVAVDDLRSGADHGSDGDDGRALLRRSRSASSGVSVMRRCPRPKLTPPLQPSPERIISVLAPMLAMVFCNGRLGALADLGHGDDGGHADDDPQRRQRRTHLVAPQGPEGRAPRGGQQRRRALSRAVFVAGLPQTPVVDEAGSGARRRRTVSAVAATWCPPLRIRAMPPVAEDACASRFVVPSTLPGCRRRPVGVAEAARCHRPVGRLIASSIRPSTCGWSGGRRRPRWDRGSPARP